MSWPRAQCTASGSDAACHLTRRCWTRGAFAGVGWQLPARLGPVRAAWRRTPSWPVEQGRVSRHHRCSGSTQVWTGPQPRCQCERGASVGRDRWHCEPWCVRWSWRHASAFRPAEPRCACSGVRAAADQRTCCPRRSTGGNRGGGWPGAAGALRVCGRLRVSAKTCCAGVTVCWHHARIAACARSRRRIRQGALAATICWRRTPAKQS